jgi:hypothetical protein
MLARWLTRGRPPRNIAVIMTDQAALTRQH